MNKRKKERDIHSGCVLWGRVAPAVELWEQLYAVRSGFNKDITVSLVVRDAGVYLKGAEGSDDAELSPPSLLKAKGVSHSTSKDADRGAFDYVG